MSKKTTNDNVRVMVRVRPFNQKELTEAGGNPICTLSCHSDTMISCIDPSNPDLENGFPFDRIFWSMPESQVPAGIPFADQLDVYKEVGVPQLDSMFDGYNGCIFAYGQTSSGKTHSMMGYEGHGRGITPRLCEELFMRIAYKASLPDDLKRTSYSVKMSYLEIYNEKVQDLLSKKSTGHDLKIVHDPKLGPTVKGLSEHAVNSWDEVNRLLIRGTETRTTAATAMNDTSSRSHAVVQISLDMVDTLGTVGNKEISRPRRSRANLVDLAGSEKISKSKVEGANLKEAIGINQSLTCLGRVIDALVENKPHVPYRDSVLTCLLADSLGGNSRTTMVAALSPAAANYDETLSTLRYASRARKIVNKIRVNEDPAAALIRELQEELSRMKLGGGFARDSDGSVMTQAAVAQQTQELQEAVAKLQELQAREEVAEQEREQKWQTERERIEDKHARELENLKAEQDELEQQKLALEERHQELNAEMATKRKMHIMNMFKHGAQISTEKSKKMQTIEQKKKLKHELIVHRLRTASQKARLQALEEAGARGEDFRARAEALERELQAARRRIEHLQMESIAKIEYDPQNLEDPRNPAHMAGMPNGEEVVYDGPLCDMCLEQPAQFRCMQSPCAGDVYCIWCDANQHRRADKRGHKRIPLGAPCECCGARESEFVCPGCENLRLCKTCDDHKHSAHQRSNMMNVGCDFCGLRDAEIACLDCPGKACSACDEVIHRATRRMNHRREMQEFWAPEANVARPALPGPETKAPTRQPVERISFRDAEPQQPEPRFEQEQYVVPEPMVYYEPSVPFAQDDFHSYVPQRPAFKRFTGPKQRSTPQWPGGSTFLVRDITWQNQQPMHSQQVHMDELFHHEATLRQAEDHSEHSLPHGGAQMHLQPLETALELHTAISPPVTLPEEPRTPPPRRPPVDPSTYLSSPNRTKDIISVVEPRTPDHHGDRSVITVVEPRYQASVPQARPTAAIPHIHASPVSQSIGPQVHVSSPPPVIPNSRSFPGNLLTPAILGAAPSQFISTNRPIMARPVGYVM